MAWCLIKHRDNCTLGLQSRMLARCCERKPRIAYLKRVLVIVYLITFVSCMGYLAPGCRGRFWSVTRCCPILHLNILREISKARLASSMPWLQPVTCRVLLHEVTCRLQVLTP